MWSPLKLKLWLRAIQIELTWMDLSVSLFKNHPRLISSGERIRLVCIILVGRFSSTHSEAPGLLMKSKELASDFAPLSIWSTFFCKLFFVLSPTWKCLQINEWWLSDLKYNVIKIKPKKRDGNRTAGKYCIVYYIVYYTNYRPCHILNPIIHEANWSSVSLTSRTRQSRCLIQEEGGAYGSVWDTEV